jgi:hypothetical protein
MNIAIAGWLAAFVTLHAYPLPRCAREDACTPDEDAVRSDASVVHELAVEAASDVAFDPDEQPVVDGAAPRSRTALRLLAIAIHESGLQPRLWRNHCRPRECDGGRATGELQLHLGPFGVELRGDRWVRPCVAGEITCVTSADVLADHREGFRVALHLLRGGGLPGYTGQPMSGPAPSWILSVEERFLAQRPPPPGAD